MDAFFASIEERENPKLKGKPIVIGADPKGGGGRGVVSTASYAARKFGIHSAMPISQAWKLCPAPQCAYLPVDMKLYGIVSERIMRVVKKCIGNGSPMEQVSVDEAYVDVSFCGSYEKAEELARVVKGQIKKQERLTCSIGIGPNKVIAKIASDFKKPDGITVVAPDEVQKFLDPMPVRKLPGIGPKTEAQLRRQGIETVLDLRLSLPKSDELFERVHGIDTTPVVEEYQAKSIGRDTTFEHDTNDQALLTKTLLELCDEVGEAVQQGQAAYKTITVRVRFDNFETHTSSHTLSVYTPSGTMFKKEALKLLFPYFRKKRAIRLIGVRVSNFVHEGR